MINTSDIKNLCINTGKKLITLPNEKDEFKGGNLTSKLIYPKYESSDEKRVSEQEARFLFVQCLEEYYKEIFYSVETPTEHRYRFKKEIDSKKEIEVFENEKSGQSAQSDLSLFVNENNNFSQKANIEFKAHNVELSHIEKDILKLLAEPYGGLFFHVVESIGNGTLLSSNVDRSNSQKNKTEQKGIIDKYCESIIKSLSKVETIDERNNKYLIFAVVIIPFDLLLYLELPVKELSSDKLWNEKFDFKYEVKRDVEKLMEITDKDKGIGKGKWNLINLNQGVEKYKFKPPPQ